MNFWVSTIIGTASNGSISKPSGDPRHNTFGSETTQESKSWKYLRTVRAKCDRHGPAATNSIPTVLRRVNMRWIVENHKEKQEFGISGYMMDKQDKKRQQRRTDLSQSLGAPQHDGSKPTQNSRSLKPPGTWWTKQDGQRSPATTECPTSRRVMAQYL
ncbi:hypothetical protein E2P81_ATG07688 [Venturia nashicola]|uniref:Uncharacterized protein n=1 Tax=Venturia nashicola TaxID=86259 RepID=A0A4Z1NW00_9PEZI|nr:hypothetical protein E6O75_ATG07852 [Venturia nashicola]TLD22495.1 hypothetical protein E2P81_ATG07688 [Venturia nashicola]